MAIRSVPVVPAGPDPLAAVSIGRWSESTDLEEGSHAKAGPRCSSC
jgi:hypothetical protein